MAARATAPRVAQGPMDPAGTAGASAEALRAVGATAELVVTFAHPFGYPNDRVLSRAQRLPYALRAPFRNDVFHFHFGYTWLPGWLDAAWARLWRRTVVMNFHGDDCR